MKKTFERHESLFSILLIVIYVMVNSYMMQKFGYTSYQSVIINTIMSISIITFIIKIKRVKYYGLIKARNPKKFLYFVPLIIISLFNLRSGIHIYNTFSDIMFHILTMINIGFLEEIIFRGFLFKMMEKDDLKSAIIVSSLTFGIGHLVNLLNGADFISTLFQVFYAIAIGYMLVMVFYKSKSLLPCIMFHIVFNSLSIFNGGSSSVVETLLLITMSLSYAVYISRRVKSN